MKKFNSILLVVIILFFSLVLEGCCFHNYRTIVYEPTCETNGVIAYACMKCGDYYEEDGGEALGHTESEWIEDVTSSCSSGLKHKECTLCHNILKIERTSTQKHNYIDGVCKVCGKKENITNEIKIDNGYIYFGEYPQTLKDDSVTVRNIPDSDGYYEGSDGERYAEVSTHKDYDSVFNNGTSIEKYKKYYFKVEPIKWKIESASNGTYKLISSVILDCQKFYYRAIGTYEDRTIDFQTVYANNYEYSDIRQWLNNDFINKAFTKELQSYIDTSIVDNSEIASGTIYSKYACNNTLDKIYLPSYKEMINIDYGYNSDSGVEDIARMKQLTDYAKILGCFMYIDTASEFYNNGNYWLRSPLYDKGDLSFISYSGFRAYGGSVESPSIGVVPTLSITIK